MNEREKRPAKLLTATDELRKLIVENPGLPLLVFAGEDANSGDWSYCSCNSCYASLGEFLDCMQEVNDEKCYCDRDDFEDDLGDNVFGDGDLTEEEYNKILAEKIKEYEPYWKPCIILYVNN